MNEQTTENDVENAPHKAGLNKAGPSQEPLWVDALKTIGVGLTMLTIVIVVGGALGIAIIAPWGRASHDCSIYCVLERQFDAYWSGR
jgi:hypothetical protein